MEPARHIPAIVIFVFIGSDDSLISGHLLPPFWRTLCKPLPLGCQPNFPASAKIISPACNFYLDGQLSADYVLGYSKRSSWLFKPEEIMEKRFYGVSSGNGNDGVSHSFPDYYVLTDEPFRLAALAMVTSFNPAFRKAALEAVDINGEADYTISAMIYNPEDVDPSEAPEIEHDEDCEDPE